MVDFKKVKLNGRYLLKDSFYYFFNGGSGFSFKMKGNSFSVLFDSCPIDAYFYVIIDRDYKNKKKYKTFKESIKIILDGEAHYIDIVKANESNDNVLKLLDLVVDGELLPYDFSYTKKARIIGDSTIAGYGILSHDGEGSIENSDSVQDFCYHALYEMGIDMDILAASGWGLAFSAYTCPMHTGICDYLDKVAVNKPNSWIDQNKYDLLIVSLGTNDNSLIPEKGEIREKRINEFVDKYKALIESQVKDNPDLKILMIYGTLKEENVYYLIEKTYQELKPLFKNLYVHKFGGDNSAISNHAFISAHESMAEELKEVIKSL